MNGCDGKMKRGCRCRTGGEKQRIGSVDKYQSQIKDVKFPLLYMFCGQLCPAE